jgi:hypothetical protein
MFSFELYLTFDRACIINFLQANVKVVGDKLSVLHVAAIHYCFGHHPARRLIYCLRKF